MTDWQYRNILTRIGRVGQIKTDRSLRIRSYPLDPRSKWLADLIDFCLPAPGLPFGSAVGWDDTLPTGRVSASLG
ncbi:MAG TPA: hypothetical protein PKC89_11100, partial [Pyrinomonadaceae bacterium]|nr:hypothetical protein [Pyrinomonadaceae bacterium]